MEKQPYYITVGTGEVMNDPTLSEWEYEIYAEPDETLELKALFEEMNQESWSGFWRSHIPIIKYHHDGANDRYDEQLKRVYRWLYDHGSEETKQHITSMKILEENGDQQH